MIRMVIMIDTDNQNANSGPTCAYSFQVSGMKAEYFPPKVEIILQNEIPTVLRPSNWSSGMPPLPSLSLSV